MRYGQLVVGPAGCGKSTYCSSLEKHGEATKRIFRCVNLDPAAEHFSYTPCIDVRELVRVDDVMEATGLGPNGALVHAMEFLRDNLDWLEEELNAYGEDEYFLFDCPGQIELYSHMSVMKDIVDRLHLCNFRVAGVYCLDVSFVSSVSRYLSGNLAALATMIRLELPHVNVLTKCDLIKDREDAAPPSTEQNSAHASRPSATADRPPHLSSQLVPGEQYEKVEEFIHEYSARDLTDMAGATFTSPQHRRLNEAIGDLLEDYDMVSLTMLDITDVESLERCLLQIDMAVQYGEDLEPKATYDAYDEARGREVDEQEGQDDERSK